MTAFRLISLPAHAAVEMILGLTLMGAPLALGLSPAAAVSAFALGAIIVGVALASATDESGGLPIATHFAFDWGMALGLLAAAVLLGLAGDRGATVIFAAAGALQVGLASITRYSASR